MLIIWAVLACRCIADDSPSEIKLDVRISGTDAQLQVPVEFRNERLYPVRIHQAIPGCGCLHVRFSKNAIASGNAGKVSVTIDTKEVVDESKKTLVLVTDDPKAERVLVEMTMHVDDPVELSSKSLFWNKDSGLDPKTLTLIERPGYKIDRFEYAEENAGFKQTIIHRDEGRWEMIVLPPQTRKVSESNLMIVCRFNSGLTKKYRVQMYVE